MLCLSLGTIISLHYSTVENGRGYIGNLKSGRISKCRLTCGPRGGCFQMSQAGKPPRPACVQNLQNFTPTHSLHRETSQKKSRMIFDSAPAAISAHEMFTGNTKNILAPSKVLCAVIEMLYHSVKAQTHEDEASHC